MDLLDLIKTQIQALPTGAHRPGLHAVLHHIETAYKHFARGQAGDDSAFTDTIYRTNMAFEGSIKEAYRVLADKDPSKLRPYDIELYLEKQNVFRDRILGQFTNYRTVWRNPASHDYSLNFDEPEAFMAMISVSAFTKLLVDEIAEHLNYVAVQRDVETQTRPSTSKAEESEPFVGRVVSALVNFPKYYHGSPSSVPIESEAQLMGALSGFLASVLSSAQITTGRILHGPKPIYVDIMGTSNGESVLIEIKRGDSPSLVDRGVEQLSFYLEATDYTDGILFLYSPKSIDYTVTYVEPRTGTDVYIVRPGPKTPEQKIAQN